MTAEASQSTTVILSSFVRALMFAICIIGSLLQTAVSAEENPRENYFPNTEPLGAEEIRVIALGTGTPNFRRSQASASWLVELGNGEKFIFDIGTGSLANLAALEIPYTYLDKIFISHLHVDHIGDLDAMFIGGWVSNRTVPLRVWGPSGREPELGINSVSICIANPSFMVIVSMTPAF